MKYMTEEEYNRLHAEAKEGQRLKALINTPELLDFAKAVPLEAMHQRERFGTDHDGGKAPEDWYWLIGHLAGRALGHHKEAERLSNLIKTASEIRADQMWHQISHHREKAVHHCITAAAACANWHAAVVGKLDMRPGVDPETLVAAAGETA